MVRNTASAGTVAGTGLIRKPSGERGATYSRDKRKSPFRLNVGWNSPRDNRSAPLASHLQLGRWCRRETPATCPSAVRFGALFVGAQELPKNSRGSAPDAACRSSDTPRVWAGHPRSGNTLALKSRQRLSAARCFTGVLWIVTHPMSDSTRANATRLWRTSTTPGCKRTRPRLDVDVKPSAEIAASSSPIRAINAPTASVAVYIQLAGGALLFSQPAPLNLR